jgi:hypothetical protein
VRADCREQPPKEDNVADINVERKGPSIWPWIIGLIVLALLIWAIAEMVRTDDRAVTTAPMAEEVTPAPAPVTETATMPAATQQFVTTCVQNGAQDMGREHEFTAECLRHLASAIEQTEQQTQQNVNVQQHTETMRQNAQQLEATPETSQQHSNFVREAALAASTAINQLHTAAPGQQQQMADPANRVRETAEAIRPGQTLLDQREETNRFFRAAGDALQQMSHAGHAGRLDRTGMQPGMHTDPRGTQPEQRGTGTTGSY